MYSFKETTDTVFTNNSITLSSASYIFSNTTGFFPIALIVNLVMSYISLCIFPDSNILQIYINKHTSVTGK